MAPAPPLPELLPARRLRRAYSAALLVIAGICLLSTTVLTLGLRGASRDAPVIGEATAQRFRAQRLARLTMQVRFVEKDSPVGTVAKLNGLLDDLEVAQASLRGSIDDLQLPEWRRRNVILALRRSDPYFTVLLEQGRRFTAEFTTAKLASEEGPVDAVVASTSNGLWVASEDYGRAMSASVDVMEYAIQERHETLGKIQLALLGLTLSTLALMALFLFQPLARMVERALEQLRASREEANEMARTRAEFLAKASHEFRTPLNAIIGFERLLLGTDLDDEQRDYVASSHRSAEHLLDLVNGILDYSKYEQGEFVLDPIPFPVRQLVEDVIELNALEARRRGLELRFDRSADLPEVVFGDPLFLKQVLVNLVRNAIKFTSEGEVSVRCHPIAPGVLRFAVADTGIGIPEAERARIFEAFRQANNTTARPFEGTGLGLTISKQLIERMGGELTLKTVQGRGTTFSFDLELPTAESTSWADEGGERPYVLSPTSPPARGTRHVLLAEDNAVNARLTRMQLEKLGHLCTVVTDGAAAVEELPRGAYALVLMDLHMAGTDGFEATRSIRDLDGPASEVPVIALTADLSDDSRRRAFEAGVDDYLTKPIRTEDLERVLESWLELGGQRA